MTPGIRPRMLYSLAGLLFMVAGLFAGLGGHSVAVYVGCGTIFLAVGLMSARREKSTEPRDSQPPQAGAQ